MSVCEEKNTSVYEQYQVLQIYFCTTYIAGCMEFAWLILSLRPWPNDQTLLAKHLKFACQAKCLTKILLVKARSRNIARPTFFASIKNYFKNITPQILFNAMFGKQCLIIWPPFQRAPLDEKFVTLLRKVCGILVSAF